MNNFLHTYSAHMENMRLRYGDRAALGDTLEKSIAAEAKARGSPQHARHILDVAIAQLSYDLAFMLERQSMMWREMEMMEEYHQRLGILEGAYGHVMAVASNISLADSIKRSMESMLAMHKKIDQESAARNEFRTNPKEKEHE